MREPNLAMAVGRAGLVTSGAWDLVFCTRQICDHNLFYRGSSFNCPLYLYPNGEMPASLFDHEDGRRPNLSASFVEEFCERLKLAFVPDGRGDLRKTVGPEDVFHYAYAVFHSPTYRRRYAEFLKTDFPRLPLTTDARLFRAGGQRCRVGRAALDGVPGPSRVRHRVPQERRQPGGKGPSHGKRQRVWINATQYFHGVPKECWDVHVGGYQVCDKWLKDRKGRELGYEDIEHYQKIVVALKETLRLMKEIDECIPGWPLG